MVGELTMSIFSSDHWEVRKYIYRGTNQGIMSPLPAILSNSQTYFSADDEEINNGIIARAWKDYFPVPQEVMQQVGCISKSCKNITIYYSNESCILFIHSWWKSQYMFNVPNLFDW